MMALRASQFFLTQLGSEFPAGFIRMDAIRIGEENHFVAIKFIPFIPFIPFFVQHLHCFTVQ